MDQDIKNVYFLKEEETGFQRRTSYLLKVWHKLKGRPSAFINQGQNYIIVSAQTDKDSEIIHYLNHADGEVKRKEELSYDQVFSQI